MLKVNGLEITARSTKERIVKGISVEVGSATELGGTYTVLRYQLYVDGAEVLLVDRLNIILKINGVDYMADIKKLL